MDAVTYPNHDVQDTIGNHFVSLKIDLLAKHPDLREASLGQRVIWSPTFIFSDSKHREIRRFVGWLEPKSFLGELQFVQAMAAFQRGEFAPANEGFARIFVEQSGTPIEPEALYWKGIAGFLAGKKDFGALRESWGRLAAEYPGSRFAQHASVIDDAPKESSP